MSKTKKYILWLVVIVAVVGATFYFKSKKPQTEYLTETARKTDVAETVSVTGELVAREQIDLSFKYGGKLVKILATVGDEVIARQKLASVSSTDLQIDLAQAEQELIYQQELLRNMKKRDDVYNSRQKDAQRALIKKAELQLDDIENKIAENSIYAPFDGIIIKKNIELNEMAVANAPVFILAKTEELIVESNISESDIVKIAVGQKAAMELDAFPASEIFEAEVFEIEPAANVIQDVVYYKTKLKLIAPDARFKNGMSANIDIKIAEKNNVLAIPARAIKTENGKKYVEILKDVESSATEKRFVESGLEGDGGLTEIVSGLNEGDNVITLVKTQ